MTTLIVTGAPDVLTISGGRAADYDELVLHRLAGPFGTYVGSDISVERFKRARLEECRIDKSFEYSIYLPELSVHADVIAISSCVFCDETRTRVCGNEITVEDCQFQKTRWCMTAAMYNFTRCVFHSDYSWFKLRFEHSDRGERSIARFCDCVFDDRFVIKAHFMELEFVNCSWDKLRLWSESRDISLSVDGRKIDFFNGATLRQYNIVRYWPVPF
jgi:hypothetical protein